MTDPARESAEQLFQRAADLPAEERAAFLDTHCGGDRALRAEIDSLLAHLGAPTPEFLKTRAPWAGTDVGAFAPGDTIADRFKLHHLLGEGGLGVVWLAEQKQPVRRKVALKLIKRGMDSAQILGRFEAERNALAILNHPNIARVLDAGETEGGQPFFAMEYVEGVPVTEFCDTERLTTQQRLELFVAICGAVQHAHQKGIIHRDLKPSNILVTLQEGQPVPKVIDFGIAKATSQDLTEMTLFTVPGQMIGTPEDMSPEQAEMSSIGVDSTTDIYSLGVVLYELLTGTLPFPTNELRQAGVVEIQRTIREVDPPKPSTRISTLGETTTEISANHGTDPRTLRSELKGDLDWIVMKALEKQRTRRYASASELAADVDRHMRHEPVLAGPPSRGYRMRKFVRRNRGAVVAVALVLLALLAGIAGTTLALLDAQRQRDRAESAQRIAVDNARQKVAVNELLQQGMGFLDPSEPAAAMAMLARAEDSIPRLFPRGDQELERAAAHTMIGSVYFLLDDLARADVHIDRAVALLENDANEVHLLPPLRQRAYMRFAQWRHDEMWSNALRVVEIMSRHVAQLDPGLGAALARLGRPVFGDSDPLPVTETRRLVQELAAAARACRADVFSRDGVAGVLYSIGFGLERRWQQVEGKPLYECAWELATDRHTKIWAGSFLLGALTDDGAPTSRQLAHLEEFQQLLDVFPPRNLRRAWFEGKFTELLSLAGRHGDAMAQSDKILAILMDPSLRDWSTCTFHQAESDTHTVSAMLFVFAAAGEKALAVERVRALLPRIESDPTGDHLICIALRVAIATDYRDVLTEADYRELLRLAELGRGRSPKRPVVADLAVAVNLLRLGSTEDLQRARVLLEPLVAALDEPEWDWYCQNAVAPLAMVQHALGSEEAAGATLEVARGRKRQGGYEGDLFDEAVAIIEGSEPREGR